jgi:hypothetical protein
MDSLLKYKSRSRLCQRSEISQEIDLKCQVHDDEQWLRSEAGWASRELDVSYSAAAWQLVTLKRLSAQDAQRFVKGGAAAAKRACVPGRIPTRTTGQRCSSSTSRRKVADPLPAR